jgi:hypothetical protein
VIVTLRNGEGFSVTGTLDSVEALLEGKLNRGFKDGS